MVAAMRAAPSVSMTRVVGFTDIDILLLASLISSTMKQSQKRCNGKENAIHDSKGEGSL